MSSWARIVAAGVVAGLCAGGFAMAGAAERPQQAVAAAKPSKLGLGRAALPEEVAFFIAKRIRSTVRALAGALRRVIANSRFTGHPITMDFTRSKTSDIRALTKRQKAKETNHLA